MASTSRVRQSNRLRSRRNSQRDQADFDDVQITASTTCIDLTADTNAEEIIDLTAIQSPLMEQPMVILTPADYVGPVRHRTGSGRLGRRRSSTNSRRRRNLLQMSPVRGSVLELASDDSDNDLATVAVEATPSGSTARNSLLQSPEGVKITCPICMDDVNQIRRSGRRVVSTNCGHIFCESCLQTAIQNYRQCPTCRKRLHNKSFHPLFI